jgi:thiamine biosynthesis lipoprotein
MTESTLTRFLAMGSECSFHLFGDQGAAARAALTEVFRIENRYSRYLSTSLLAEINRVAAVGGGIGVDDETAALLDHAFACHRKSGGLFDITTGILRRAWDFSSGRVPPPEESARWLRLVGLPKVRWERPLLSFPVAGMELDFGGLAKEYAADRAAEVCRDHGIAHGLVDLGGDIRVVGPRPDGSPWSICIRDPRTPGSSLAQVSLFTGGLATSGDYERYVQGEVGRLGHILSPVTGRPVHGLASVSVIADTCLVAGSLATIAMLKADGGAGWLGELAVPSLWLDAAGCTGGRGDAFHRDRVTAAG